MVKVLVPDSLGWAQGSREWTAAGGTNGDTGGLFLLGHISGAVCGFLGPQSQVPSPCPGSSPELRRAVRSPPGRGRAAVRKWVPLFSFCSGCLVAGAALLRGARCNLFRYYREACAQARPGQGLWRPPRDPGHVLKLCHLYSWAWPRAGAGDLVEEAATHGDARGRDR